MPIVSFRVTAEVHERLLKLAEERSQTLTALMQETASHIVERTQEPTLVARVRMNERGTATQFSVRSNMPPQHDPNAEHWQRKAEPGERLKKDKSK